jgi:cytochrome c biogenesis protein CcmG/thiol:disulfide interchange protein DsbE
VQSSEIFQQAIDRLLIYCLEWDKFDMTDTSISPRPRRWDFVMVVSLAAAIMWTVGSRVPSAVGAPLSSSPSPREGFFAPDFTLGTLQGEQVKLSELRGKIVMVNFWTTWCPPCRAETPALETSYKSYKDSDVVILGVNLTDQDSLKDVESFVQEFGLTYPILLDRDGVVGLLYQLNGLPTTFFISREGIIRTVVVGGPMSETFIRSKIEALLKEAQ